MVNKLWTNGRVICIYKFCVRVNSRDAAKYSLMQFASWVWIKQLRILAAIWISLTSIAHAIEVEPPINGCQSIVVQFLNRPTKYSLTKLTTDGNSKCWSVIGESNTRHKKLLRWVKNGNYWAALYLADNLKNLDGGNWEDSEVALGEFSEIKTEQFLTFALKGKLTEEEFTRALVMLPLSLSDDTNGQIKVLKSRRSKFARVARPELYKQKSIALITIDEFIATVSRTK